MDWTDTWAWDCQALVTIKRGPEMRQWKEVGGTLFQSENAYLLGEQNFAQDSWAACTVILVYEADLYTGPSPKFPKTSVTSAHLLYNISFLSP